MGLRTDLQTILEVILGTDKVYFQPPSNVKMVYPCILYKRVNTDTQFADNSPYRHTKHYQVSVIDQNPDSLIPDKVAELPLCSHTQFYTADNLNHDVFDLYF